MRDDKKIQEEVVAWMACYKRDHFPQGLSVTLEPVVNEILFDAYLDGIRYGQELGMEDVGNQSRIIKPGDGRWAMQH